MTESGPAAERELAGRVVSALLRENYGGLAGRVTREAGRAWLSLPRSPMVPAQASPSGPSGPIGRPGPEGRGRSLPLEPDGFLWDYRVAVGTPLTLDDVRETVAVLAGTRDASGAAVFDAECRRTLAETRLRARLPPSGRLPAARSIGSGPADADPAPAEPAAPWTGAAGQLRYDALAAALPHPVYPASPCRLGFTDDDLLAYAPEFSPGFELRWAAVPKLLISHPDPGPASPSTVRPSTGSPGTANPAAAGDATAWWPSLARVGLPPDLAATHELFPVHPLTARGDGAGALAAAGAVLGPDPYLEVRPTLSVRTVAVATRPEQHVKLPLAVSTLGLRNRRTIVGGTLADGALVCRTLGQVRAADAASPGDSPLSGLLLADDTRWAHAGHPLLGYLLRRLPVGLVEDRVVPVAALCSRAPSGRLVFEELAGRRDGILEFADEYFRLVFDVAVRLGVRYGIALESHQQNAALVTGPGRPPRLLVKDFDGALINLGRLTAALGAGAPEAGDFTDPRLLTDNDEALADVFVTITVHLCVGAVAFGLARAGTAPLGELLGLARRALRDALDAEGGEPAAKLLRSRVLESARLTGKSMVTAGTLTAKEHTGAADVNKHYATTGPNYLEENR